MLSKILNYYFELKYTLFVYQEIALKLKTNAKIPELKSSLFCILYDYMLSYEGIKRFRVVARQAELCLRRLNAGPLDILKDIEPPPGRMVSLHWRLKMPVTIRSSEGFRG